jgi:SAM-dependent methyltransferase
LPSDPAFLHGGQSQHYRSQEPTLGHSHDHSHPQGPVFDENSYTREFWDDRYGSTDRLWSGNPNPQLVAQTAGLRPGTALEAGCGEGADAIWLAIQGWTVTAVDVSQVAIERGAGHAAAADEEAAARISWQREDLKTWDPGTHGYDLVSAQFMHMPSPTYEDMCRRLAGAVRPGGTLLIVGHHPDDMHQNLGRAGHPGSFPAPEQLAALLDAASWEIAVADAVRRPAADLDGQPVTVTDTVLRAVRRR